MKRSDSLNAIYSTELTIAQSRENTLTGLHRANIALRSTLSRPTTLVLVAGAAGVFGFWLERRHRSTRASADVSAIKPSLASIFLAVVVKYGMQLLPFIIQKFKATQEQGLAHAEPDLAKDDPLYQA